MRETSGEGATVTQGDWARVRAMLMAVGITPRP